MAARRRAMQSLRAHVPALATVDVGELGHGLDNAAFLAGDLVLRVADGHSVLQEARLLGVVAAHVSVPVPMVRFVDEDAGVLAYPLLPGRPLLGRPASSGLARPLGCFLSELHAIDTATVDGLVLLEHAHPGEWLEDIWRIDGGLIAEAWEIIEPVAQVAANLVWWEPAQH